MQLDLFSGKFRYVHVFPPHFIKMKGKNYLVPLWLEVPDFININNWEKYVEFDSSPYRPKIETLAKFESKSSPGLFYLVKKVNNRIECDCPGFKFRKGKCKHTKKVMSETMS
tara:strand:- start:123 stop:458 length:336 start_codon:yes stop_codon:yes gene_type:complete